MKKVYATLETGFSNAYYEEIFEFDDDATEKEIDEVVEEWGEEIKSSEMTYGWEEID